MELTPKKVCEAGLAVSMAEARRKIAMGFVVVKNEKIVKKDREKLSKSL